MNEPTFVPDPSTSEPEGGEAAAQPTLSTSSGFARPSLWSAFWAALALVYLMWARRSYGRLGR